MEHTYGTEKEDIHLLAMFSDKVRMPRVNTSTPFKECAQVLKILHASILTYCDFFPHEAAALRTSMLVQMAVK